MIDILYATTDILDSVLRACVDDFDAIQAGSFLPLRFFRIV